MIIALFFVFTVVNIILPSVVSAQNNASPRWADAQTILWGNEKYKKTTDDPKKFRSESGVTCPNEIVVSADNPASGALYTYRDGQPCTAVGPPQTISITNTEALAQPSDSDAKQTDETCESNAGPIGWLLCAVLRPVYGAMKWLIENTVYNLLELDLTKYGDSLKNVWNGFRVLANVALILVFMAIIYAQATGSMLDTYSVKKMLPRLLIGSILIQLSFIVVVLTVNIVNTLGAGVGQLMMAPLDGMTQFEIAGLFSNNGNKLFTETGINGNEAFDIMLTNVLAIPGAIVAGYALYYFFLALFMGAVIGLIILFVVLVLRNLIIISLMVTAPIAFVLWILPNTEQFFKAWWSIFFKSLLMYPIIVILISAGSLMGRLAVAGENTNFIDTTIGFIATFAPFFLMTATFKWAGMGVAALGSAISNMGNRVKGDLRDPNSLRSKIRGHRSREFGRALRGEKRVMGIPNVPYLPVRTMMNRLPGVNNRTGLINDLSEGQKWASDIIGTGHDDVVRAMAMTGGGRYRGTKVGTSDGGKMNSGYLKMGKHFMYNPDGSIMTRNGSAVLGSYNRSAGRWEESGLATKSDFYSDELMAQVHNNGISRGKLQAALNYAMSKSVTEEDQTRVWEGLRSSKWEPEVKNEVAEGIWYNNKDNQLQHKFYDRGDYFKSQRGAHDASVPVPMNMSPEKLVKSFKGMTEFVDRSVDSYALGRQGGSFWRYATNGMVESHNSEGIDLNSDFGLQVRGMYEKAVQATERTAGAERDPDTGQPIGYTQSAQEAVREMRSFIDTYRSLFGGNGN